MNDKRNSSHPKRFLSVTIALPLALVIMCVFLFFYIHKSNTSIHQPLPLKTVVDVSTVTPSPLISDFPAPAMMTPDPSVSPTVGIDPTSSIHNPATPTCTTCNPATPTRNPATPTRIPVPSPTIPPSVSIPSQIVFDFESGTQNWGTSEGNYKLAQVSTTSNPVHMGGHSLQITTELFGDTSQAYADAATPSNGEKTVYLHTEATVYFDPIDLSGKTISCYLYLPAGLVNTPHETYVRLFAKDASYRNNYSQAVNIANDYTINNWFSISLPVGINADLGFDSHTVKGFGLRVETPSGSTLNYTGNYYIDDCVV